MKHGADICSKPREEQPAKIILANIDHLCSHCNLWLVIHFKGRIQNVSPALAILLRLSQKTYYQYKYDRASKDQSESQKLRSRMVLPQVGAMKASTVSASGKPYLIYGTAWKKDQTKSLVSQAVHAGFRFIDTACQPKHYNEQGVGQGWVQAAKELGLSREDFFLQTKFTPISGQDKNRIPY